MLSTLGKSSQVLELFSVAHPERGVSEVADVLGMPKTSAHSLLATLAAVGLLRRTEGSRYRLGWKLLRLRQSLLDSTRLLQEARPAMEQLATRFGESVQLAILTEDRVVCLEQVRCASASAIQSTARSRPASALEQVLRRPAAAGAVADESSVAAPIAGPRGRTAAALAIRASSVRMARSRDALRDGLVQACREVSMRLAGRG